MFAAALVIFREILEIVLIVGVILAATSGMPGRSKAIMSGIVLGIMGSILIAYFANQIANFADGMGQEIINASILFFAAGFIGWTIIWMKKHAREMRAKFSKIGDDIVKGETPLYMLSLIIGLTIFREGAEIVLFTYGMIAAKQSISSIALGALIGGSSGLAVGLMLYFSLVRIPVKYFFMVTSYMLVLLVAGMISHAFGYLVAAGYFAELSATVWNSSFLLSDRSFLGEIMAILIGYTARPSVIQIIAYFSTITLFIYILGDIQRMFGKGKNLNNNS